MRALGATLGKSGTVQITALDAMKGAWLHMNQLLQGTWLLRVRQMRRLMPSCELGLKHI